MNHPYLLLKPISHAESIWLFEQMYALGLNWGGSEPWQRGHGAYLSNPVDRVWLSYSGVFGGSIDEPRWGRGSYTLTNGPRHFLACVKRLRAATHA